MQNVLKLKNMYFYEDFFFLNVHLGPILCFRLFWIIWYAYRKMMKRTYFFLHTFTKNGFCRTGLQLFFLRLPYGVFMFYGNKIGLTSYISGSFTVFWWEKNILVNITNIREPELEGVACFWPLGAGAAWEKMLITGVTWEKIHSRGRKDWIFS